MAIDITNEKLEKITLFGEEGLFCNCRVKNVPEGLYSYDTRDDCDGIIYEIRDFIMVNHWATLLFKRPLEEFAPEAKKEIDSHGKACWLVNEEEDFGFLDGSFTPEEFLKEKE